MIPVQFWRLILAIVAFSAFIAGFEGLVSLAGGSGGQRDQLSTVMTGLVIAAYPQIAPWLLPMLVSGRLKFSSHAERVIAQLYQVIPPHIHRPKTIILAVTRPMALAVGTARSPVLFISVPMLESLADQDLRAVLAHEMGHLHHGHSVQTCLFLAGLFMIKAFFVMPTVLVIGTFLSYLGIIRHQEYQADAYGSVLVGVPAMQSMLERLSAIVGEAPERSRMASIAITTLSTHPSFSDRVLALQAPRSRR